MAQAIKDITLEVSKPNVFPALVAKQSDSNSRFLNATLVNEGEKISIASSSTVEINACRPDKSVSSFSGEINDDGTVKLPLDAWILEQAGLVTCDVSVMDSDEHKLTSTSFLISVEVSVNAEGVISDGEAAQRANAEAERVKAEEKRVTAENSRIVAENERRAAENARVAAEMERQATLPAMRHFANAIKGSKRGTSIVADDVSFIEHDLGVKVTNKSIIPYPYTHTTREQNGIKFTDNGDGSVTASGTATGTARFSLISSSAPMIIGKGKSVKLMGCPKGGSTSTYMLQIQAVENGEYKESKHDVGAGATLTTAYENYYVQIAITKGTTINNLVFNPVLVYTDEMITDFSNITVKCGNVLYGDDAQTITASPDGTVTGLHSIAPNMALWTEYGVIEVDETLEKLYFDTNANIDAYLVSLDEKYETLGNYKGSYQLITNSSYSTLLIATNLGISNMGSGYTLSIAYLASTGSINSITPLYSSVKFDLSSYCSGYKADKEGWQTDSIDFPMTVYDLNDDFAPLNGTIIKDKPNGIINVEYSKDTNKVIEQLTQAIISLGGNV